MFKRALGVFLLVSTGAWGQDAPETLFGRKIVNSGDMISIIRGDIPRAHGTWDQYWGMSNPLRGNVIISDVLNPSDQWYDYKGQKISQYDISKQTPQNYHSSHNHYQNFLSEVRSFTPGANAVALWGDSSALVNGGAAWGGFVSARSWCRENDIAEQYNKDKVARGCGPEFDAQLTGLEVDVLNDGKPGTFPNKAKHGVQVVGFGNPNGQALSVIVENFDREKQHQKGQFEAILYAQNSLHPDYGRMLVADFPEASMGLDFRKPLFRDGAMRFRSEGVGTGININDGRSGEIYGGLRWPGFADKSNWLTVRAGEGGFRVASQDNTQELFALDNYGGLYLNGDVYVGGHKILTRDGNFTGTSRVTIQDAVLFGLIGISLLMNVLLLFRRKGSFVQG